MAPQDATATIVFANNNNNSSSTTGSSNDELQLEEQESNGGPILRRQDHESLANSTTTPPRIMSDEDDNSNETLDTKGSSFRPRPLYWFSGVVAIDSFLSIVLLLPISSTIEKAENIRAHFSLSGSLWDLALIAALRILSIIGTLLLAYYYPRRHHQHDDDSCNNNHNKTKEELELEALEESYYTKLRRHVSRYSFVPETMVLLTAIWISIKAMARLNVEIGIYQELHPYHPIFWIALLCTGILSLIECTYVDSIESMIIRQRKLRDDNNPLTEPLLSSTTTSSTARSPEGEEEECNSTTTNNLTTANKKAAKNISGLDDCDYKSSWADIVEFVLPDKYWILLATIFLLAASICNVFIPHFTGKILDALVGDDGNDNNPLFFTSFSTTTTTTTNKMNIPKGFVANIEMLVLVSILGGIFAGCRGAIFSTMGARCNARLRVQLMDSLLCQDIGFYDTTRTGDITSRLSSDTTLVGSAITNNVNVFLRSIVRAAGVLIFMCFISWQLTLLAFLTIPAVSVLSKWYGRYVRKLSKAQQKKLAEGNNVSECVISSMATVRAFGAERMEMKEFEDCMDNFLQFNQRSAIATFGYQTFVGALPQLVKALVLFYGGLLVQSERNPMTGGQLITFVLYLSTLAESFNSLGGIYAALSRAVGASEKVFALMHRKPRRTVPKEEMVTGTGGGESGNFAAAERDMEGQQPLVLGESSAAANTTDDRGDANNAVRKKSILRMILSSGEKRKRQVEEVYSQGRNPSDDESPLCTGLEGRGQITFSNVEARYPARPQRVVLDGLELTIPAGSVCALVGPSGGGKSSIVKLIQNLYEPNKGKVSIDGIDVRQLSQEWMAKHVAVVSQEPVLFAKSVRENIIYGLDTDDCNITDDEIKEAARKANADTFIERLPQGYDTEVGERGIQLSGGQKQSVAIARAIVRRPRILLLDESTAALDSESEFIVQQAIDDMISEQRRSGGASSSSPMTVLMIAHRLSTVRNADIIFVVENGKVVEQGCHAELIAREEGVYKTLVSRQMNTD